MVVGLVSAAAAASGVAKIVPAALTGAAKIVPVVAGAAKVVPVAISGALKVVPLVGTVASVAGTIAAAIKTATALIGIGKIAILPILIASLAYYNYDLFDPENRPFNVQQVDREYDFIIVGGGSAGSVLANRLTEISNWKVLLLEAGGHETEISDVPILSLYLHKSKLDWKYRSQPQPSACQAMVDNRCCWTRGKVLGGSSVLNTMLYIRGNKRDFDQWESFGNPGWGHRDVLPYFRKSQDQRNPYLARNEKHHGSGGYLTVEDAPYHTPLGAAFLQAGEEMGYDIVDVNGDQQTGFAFYQFTMRRGSRCSTAKAFLRPIRLRKNLHVSLQSHVTRIIVDPKTKRAVGVEFFKEGGPIQHVYAKREVILSAGAIGSPHILLNSGIGPKEHLESVGVHVVHDLPGVGQNLQDHVAIGGLAFTINTPAGIVANRMINFNSAIRYAISEEGPLTSSIGLETVAFINTKYANRSDDWPDMNFLMTSASIFSDQQVKLAHGLKPEFYNDMYKELTDRDAFSILPMILRPKSRGFMKLRSRNPLDYPLLYHNYLTHPEDIAVMREGVKLAIATGETQALKKFGAQFHSKPLPNCRHLPLYTDEYWECVIKQYTMTIYHMSGTCKMGPNTDPLAVVNHRLQVHGIKGLRVIDASIMPTVTSGNTNAPTIMIGEKGADLVKALWLRKEMFRSGRYKRKINKTKDAPK